MRKEKASAGQKREQLKQTQKSHTSGDASYLQVVFSIYGLGWGKSEAGPTGEQLKQSQKSHNSGDATYLQVVFPIGAR